METLLAVDLGLRTGLALYTSAGELSWYRSQNYGSSARLKRAIYGILQDLPSLRYLVVEGGGPLAVAWTREAERRNVRVLTLQAERWRQEILLPRDRRGSHRAKERAEDLAPRVIAWAGGKAPTSLRHDAAEAILIGLWGLHTVGWIDKLPDFVL